MSAGCPYSEVFALERSELHHKFTPESCCKLRKRKEGRQEKKRKSSLSHFPRIVPVFFITSRRAGYFLALPNQPLIVKTHGWAASHLPVQLALSPKPDVIIEGNGFSRGINTSYQVSKWNNFPLCVHPCACKCVVHIIEIEKMIY